MNHHAGIPTQCDICSAKLGPHNLTGLCAECKLITRNKRMSPTYDDSGQITYAEAIQNITTILGGRIITEVGP